MAFGFFTGALEYENLSIVTGPGRPYGTSCARRATRPRSHAEVAASCTRTPRLWFAAFQVTSA